jgi:hypothetical protein
VYLLFFIEKRLILEPTNSEGCPRLSDKLQVDEIIQICCMYLPTGDFTIKY